MTFRSSANLYCKGPQKIMNKVLSWKVENNNANKTKTILLVGIPPLVLIVCLLAHNKPDKGLVFSRSNLTQKYKYINMGGMEILNS